MGTFSPHTFLTSQGWAGTGNGLRKDSIKKPVTVAHKTNLKGIGKERDTGYAWWDDVFSMVANKKKGSETPESRKTSTGLHSPLPPGSLSAATSAPSSGTSTPIASTSSATAIQPSGSGGAHFHADLIGQAKLEAARREFYSKFMRGRPLAGTVSENDDDNEDEEVAKTPAVVPESGGSSSDASSSTAKLQAKLEKAQRKQEKEERRRIRKEKKDRKEKRKADKAETAAPTDNGVQVAGKSNRIAEEGEERSIVRDYSSKQLASDDNKTDTGSHITSKTKKSKGKRKLDDIDEAALPESASDSHVDSSEASKAERKARKKLSKKKEKKSKSYQAEEADGSIAEASASPMTDPSNSQLVDGPASEDIDERQAKKRRKEEKRKKKAKALAE